MGELGSMQNKRSVSCQSGTSRLRAVVLVVRHGARYPLKPFPGSTHWPQYDSFWENAGGKDYPERHAGHLTKVGHRQLKSFGKICRSRYLDEEGLFDDNNPLYLGGISACSSKVERTEKSAKSFLKGMFPETVDSIELQIRQTKYCTLLHGFRCSSKFKAMQTKALCHDALCGKVHSYANGEFYPRLTEKLWEMTGFEKLDPVFGSIANRLMHFQPIAQMIRIERAHNIPLLMNRKGVELAEDEVSGVMDLAGRICRLRYCGCNDEEQRDMSRFAAGLLPMKIIELFREVKNPGSINRFQLYSAHDNTIMAMLAFMGFKKWPIPEFAAHLVFELYERDGEWEVEFMYNSHPQYYAFENDIVATDSTDSSPIQRRASPGTGLSRRLTFFEPIDPIDGDIIIGESTMGDFMSSSMKKAIYPVRLPKAEHHEAPPIVSWNSRDFGSMTFEDFEEILLDQRRCFRNQEEWDDVERKYLEEAQLPATPAGPERVKKMVGNQSWRKNIKRSSEPVNQLLKSLRGVGSRNSFALLRHIDEEGELDVPLNSGRPTIDHTADIDGIVDFNRDFDNMALNMDVTESVDLTDSADLANRADLLDSESFGESDSDDATTKSQ